MSISFAAPPVIERSVTPPPIRESSRRLSQSSLRSARSDGSRPRKVGSSPPPDGRFTKRVSFDTFTNPDAAVYSLTLKVKHKEYRYKRTSRTYLIGYDTAEYSASALEWLLDTLADDGDEIIALRAIEPRGRGERDMDEVVYRREARRIVDEIVERNDEDKHVSIVVEHATGNVKTLLMHMIHLYHPDSLIVGTKGRNLNSISGLVPNSMSKWCLQNSPVPVIVVRPDRKRTKAKKKRLADPTRRSYLEILEKSSSFDDLERMFGNAQLQAAASASVSAGRTSTERGRQADTAPVTSSPLATPAVERPPSKPTSASASTSSASLSSHNPPEAVFDASRPGAMLLVPGMLRNRRTSSGGASQHVDRPGSSSATATVSPTATTSKRGKSPLGRLFKR